MARPIQRQCGEKRQHEPRETCDRERLLPAQAPRLDAQEAQRRASNEKDADGEEVAFSRLPFSEDNRREQRRCQTDRREQDEHAKVVADDAQVVE